MKPWCDYCDPQFFMIFGFCGNCSRRCEPPLFDTKGQESFLDYEEKRRKWIEERVDLIIHTRRASEK